MKLSVWLFLVLLVSGSALNTCGQQASNKPAEGDGCSLPQPPLGANRPNLFNEAQEQWLGDALAAEEEPKYVLLPEKDSEELTKIGEKLLAQLPPTPIHYRFRVYASEELNGFSLAGGYIYVSRKLILDARSEDEVAGVLAHEIGHIYTHQVATSVSRSLDKMLHVSSLGGRDDVDDKFQRMLNAPWKWHSDLAPDEAEKDELKADAVGLYALVRAGYAPQAFATNLERIADSRGRNGNILSDVLGATSEVGMRVRTARKLVNASGDACKRRVPASSQSFLDFQKALMSSPVNPLMEATADLNFIALTEPVRPGLNLVRFSPDGKYLLAQNEEYIYVLTSSPLKLQFKVYAPSASAAHFTPDSGRLVFHYQSLRVEEWDVASSSLLGTHEVFEYRGCWQSELSPDGKLLACVFRNRDAEQLSLELFDVGSGKVVFDKETFFLPDTRAQAYKLQSRLDWDPEELAVAFSPDSRYMVVAGVTNNFAMDLSTLQPVKMRGELAGILQGRLMFTVPDQLLYDCDAGQREIFNKPEANLCLAEFPSGVKRAKFVEGWEGMSPVGQGNYLVAGSYFDSIPHLVDLVSGKPSNLLKFPAADVFGKLLAVESGKGGVTVGEIGSAKVETVDLPVTVLPYARVARFSPDGRYLALSNENRGAIWDLAANRQIALTRCFRGAWFDDSGQLYLQVTAGQLKPGQNMRVDLKTGAVAETGKYDYDVSQLMDVQLDEAWFDKKKGFNHNMSDLTVYDGTTGAVLWKKKFGKDVPAISQQEPGVLVMFWGMEGETAWDEILHSSVLTKSADETREEHQGSLTELVDSHSGKMLRQVMSPEGAKAGWGKAPGTYSSESDERTAKVFGSLVTVHGNENNTVVYNSASGARLMAFWGRAVAGDGKLGLIAATNREQELIVYDAATGKESLHAVLDNRVLAARFVAERKQLMVVTSGQRVYTFDVSSPSGVLAEVR